MTDAKTRTTRRAAAAGDPDAARRLLVEQIRAESLRPGLRVESQGGRVIRLGKRECPGNGGWPCEGSWKDPACKQCSGTGTIPLDPQAVLRLMAYVGDEAAREMVPVSECSIRAGRWDSWEDHDRHVPLDTWLRRLSVQAEHMPPVVGERADRYAMDCPGDWECKHPQSCPVRHVPGSTWSYPYTRWLLASVATRVAEGVLPAWEQAEEVCESPGCDCGWERPRRAVEAARAWVLCPCPEHEEELLRQEVAGCVGVIVAGGTKGAPGRVMAHSSRLTTEDQVRAWVQGAAREAVLGG